MVPLRIGPMRTAVPNFLLGHERAAEKSMKGPGGRVKFDLRRIWECPACQQRELTSGDIVSRQCGCGANADPPRTTWMRLIETKPVRAPAPPPDAATLPEPTTAPSPDGMSALAPNSESNPPAAPVS